MVERADPDRDRRHDRYWPRDGPIRWHRFGLRLAYEATAVAALAAHLVIGGILVVTLRAEPVDWLLALAWGGLAVFAAWSWFRRRWRIAVAPVVAAVLVVASGRVPGQ